MHEKYKILKLNKFFLSNYSSNGQLDSGVAKTMKVFNFRENLLKVSTQNLFWLMPNLKKKK